MKHFTFLAAVAIAVAMVVSVAPAFANTELTVNNCSGNTTHVLVCTYNVTDLVHLSPFSSELIPVGASATVSCLNKIWFKSYTTCDVRAMSLDVFAYSLGITLGAFTTNPLSAILKIFGFENSASLCGKITHMGDLNGGDYAYTEAADLSSGSLSSGSC